VTSTTTTSRSATSFARSPATEPGDLWVYRATDGAVSLAAGYAITRGVIKPGRCRYIVGL